MHALSHDHIGTRIKRLRKERHLTQKALADLSGISYSTVTKIEQGTIAATPYTAAAIARALRVEVATVIGQPYVDELRADEIDVLILPIREALDVYDLGPDPDITPRTIEVLSRQAWDQCVAMRAGEIKKVAAGISGLIQETTTAAHLAGTTEGWKLLAGMYRTAYDVGVKLGYPDLAALSLARCDWAAQKASDAVIGGMSTYMRALTYMRQGQYRTGQRLVALGLGTLGQAGPGRERDVVTGQLHLGAAVMSGRAKDAERAHDHLATADRIAETTGEAIDVHWLAFGPTNVKVHRVSLYAELDEYGRAVEEAGRFAVPADWPKSRTSHHHAEVARAQMWTGKLEQAFASLVQARKTNPQQAKYHPTVRETYAGLEAAHRQLPDSFLSYGSWLSAAR